MSANEPSLENWLATLLQRHPDDIDLGVERVRSVAETLGLAAPEPLVITVAGTNGKGSSVAMLAAIYRAAGYAVGTYTSPHLHRFNERIQIQAQPAGDAEIIAAFEAIDHAAGDTRLTYFEVATLAALWVFSQHSLDLVILEVGLGGRLDAVNLVDADACLITAIDVDHQEWLGDDRENIGREKAGVMRPGRPCVCSDRAAPASVLAQANALGTPLRRLGQDFDWRDEADGKNDQAWWFLPDGQGQAGAVAMPTLPLAGRYQRDNASGVLALVDWLGERFPVSRDQMAKGLQATQHPGRMQRLQTERGHWLLDVAHNPQAAGALAQALPKTGQVCVFAVMADKDVAGMIAPLQGRVARWVLPPLSVARALEPHALAEALQQAGVAGETIYLTDSMTQALEKAESFHRDGTDEALICGSFYTVAEALTALKATNSQTMDEG
ncbi:bifunctional folylpolyglutamate synthase/dihydrofolate synthase [Hydrogenovibrio halophilus]|uniref:bifunctional folylpolyglutamate synthase/dihydrofolate synthase n=1 Tax=Hydrogenovibrio halophilus TaxID=373391 RepID=UPI0003A13430|nr:folylpolyglutamate synthase/dihydrofolate synthase family protein [Hydrogenovibrio halophilus]